VAAQGHRELGDHHPRHRADTSDRESHAGIVPGPRSRQPYIEDLLAMKRAANRPPDQTDIQALEAIVRLRRRPPHV